MSNVAIRLLMLALCTTALALVPTVKPAKAETGSGGHSKKHKKHWRTHFSEPWFVGRPPPVAPPYSQAGPVCPGIARSFDCRVWPPPYEDDPDRKVSKY